MNSGSAHDKRKGVAVWTVNLFIDRSSVVCVFITQRLYCWDPVGWTVLVYVVLSFNSHLHVFGL